MIASNDELLSTLGFVLGVCLTKDEASKNIRAVRHIHGAATNLFRPTILITRELLEHPADAIELLSEDKLDQAKKLISLEYECGLIPAWFFSSFDCLKNKNLGQFLMMLLWSEVENAADALEAYQIIDVLSEELILQHAFLYFLSAKAEKAEELIAKHKEIEKSDNLEVRFRYFELQAYLLERREKVDEAAELLEKAILCTTADNVRFSTVGTWLGMYYLEKGNLEKSESVLTQVVEREPAWIPAQMSRFFVYMAQDRADEVDEILSSVMPYAGNNPRVFSFFKGRQLANKVPQMREKLEAEKQAEDETKH